MGSGSVSRPLHVVLLNRDNDKFQQIPTQAFFIDSFNMNIILVFVPFLCLFGKDVSSGGHFTV